MRVPGSVAQTLSATALVLVGAKDFILPSMAEFAASGSGGLDRTLGSSGVTG